MAKRKKLAKKSVKKSRTKPKAKLDSKRSIRAQVKKARPAKAKKSIAKVVEGASAKSQHIELQSVDTFFELKDGQPTLRHKRCFTNTSSDRLLFLLLGVKFYGLGGLMVTSIADSEECSADASSRLVRNFRPMQNAGASVVAGSFNITQKVLEFSMGPLGISALVQMSFSPTSADGPGPTGSLLWAIEPGRNDLLEPRAYWSDLVNTEETARRGFHLKVKPGSAEILMALHNRLIGGAARRVAEILNASSYESGVVFSSYVKSGRLDFLRKS